ncbi:MAG: tetratricopeptide repeat protein [Flavobacteriales bacterium]|nr:tetratricopeptide repeat protein [Bacteroidota bacterium]MCB9239618.1 tetratricopeptide repeat protein [Flavobacteriales bacterium]
MNRIEQLQKFMESDPGDPFLRYALAIEYIGIQNVDGARKLFEELLESNPDYSATYYHLGKLYQKEGNTDRAEEIYRQGIQLTQRKREQHQLAELQTALNNMLYED